MKKGRTAVDDREDNVRIQEFLDMIAPSVIKFETDHFICGNTYRCVWALREYPTATGRAGNSLTFRGERWCNLADLYPSCDTR